MNAILSLIRDKHNPDIPIVRMGAHRHVFGNCWIINNYAANCKIDYVPSHVTLLCVEVRFMHDTHDSVNTTFVLVAYHTLSTMNEQFTLSKFVYRKYVNKC